MIWAAKKGSKGESLQNALKILCDFCLLLLKQLIPARGRKLPQLVAVVVCSVKQLIPARGQNALDKGTQRKYNKSVASPRGDGELARRWDTIG